MAIVLISVGMFALMGELVAYLHHQATEKSRAAAVRLMVTTLEDARLDYDVYKVGDGKTGVAPSPMLVTCTTWSAAPVAAASAITSCTPATPPALSINPAERRCTNTATW